jgi:hypothetical protein
MDFLGSIGGIKDLLIMLTEYIIGNFLKFNKEFVIIA